MIDKNINLFIINFFNQVFIINNKYLFMAPTLVFNLEIQPSYFLQYLLFLSQNPQKHNLKLILKQVTPAFVYHPIYA